MEPHPESILIMATIGEVAHGRPLAHEVVKAIRDLPVEQTKTLVFQLGVPLGDLDDIDAHHNGDMAKAHYVQKWLDMYPDASWEKLVAALRDIRMNRLAADVECSRIPRIAITDPTSSVSTVDTCHSRGRSYSHEASSVFSLSDDYDHEEKVLLCGDRNVGKTSLISRFSEDYLKNSHIPTVQVELKVKTICIREKVIRIKIWDTPGEERFAAFTARYYKKAWGIVVMYDITNEKSFENVAKWMNNIKMNAAGDVHIVLVGNKIDLEGQRKISRERGERLAERFGVKFFETSALDNRCNCVDEPFMSLYSQNLEAMIRDVQTEQNHGIAVTRLGERESSGRATSNKWCCCC